jgi:uncharacterized protein
MAIASLRESLDTGRAARASHDALLHTHHRPWPVPRGPWVGRQRWQDLLFAHWPAPAASLRRHVPDELTIQSRDGTSWVGVTAFRMTGVSVRGVPDLPWLSHFTELNVRLYVEAEAKPGVWFLSLDADRLPAVLGARVLLNLPYVRARMSLEHHGPGVEFRSERPGAGPRARFSARYEPSGPPRDAAPASLEHFLTERYCLYTRLAGRLRRVQIHHAPWPLQDASGQVDAGELLASHGLDLGEGSPPLLHFSRSLDVVIWPPEPVGDR